MCIDWRKRWARVTYSWCNQVLWSPQMVRKNTSRRWDLQLEVGPPIGGEISNWRWHLRLEVGPPIGGTHVTCRNQLFFWKKKRLFILDYIKPSPVYQVKCKLVKFRSTLISLQARRAMNSIPTEAMGESILFLLMEPI